MDYGFWSDGTPCSDHSAYINKYFEGREFRHRQHGHAVIHGYGKYNPRDLALRHTLKRSREMGRF